jgi:hypothetical protein
MGKKKREPHYYYASGKRSIEKNIQGERKAIIE